MLIIDKISTSTIKKLPTSGRFRPDARASGVEVGLRRDAVGVSPLIRQPGRGLVSIQVQCKTMPVGGSDPRFHKTKFPGVFGKVLTNAPTKMRTNHLSKEEREVANSHKKYFVMYSWAWKPFGEDLRHSKAEFTTPEAAARALAKFKDFYKKLRETTTGWAPQYPGAGEPRAIFRTSRMFVPGVKEPKDVDRQGSFV